MLLFSLSWVPQFVLIPVIWIIGSNFPVQISRNGAERSYTVSFQKYLMKHGVRGIQEGCIFYKRWNTKHVVNAASGHPLESEPGTSSPEDIQKPVKNAIDAFYRFSRPHTVIGTVKFVLLSIDHFLLFWFIWVEFKISMLKHKEYWSFFLSCESGIKHNLSFSPRSREKFRLLFIILHRCLGSNAPWLFLSM